MDKPSDNQTVMPYLILKNTQGFQEFTKEVFGAKVLKTHMNEDNTSIMHGEVQIGGDSTIMFGEASGDWDPQPANFFIYVPDVDKSYQQALACGAKSVMDVTDKDYGRSCGVLDPYGNTWWITTP